MRALDRKRWRDLWRLRGQAIAVALLVACAVSVYVASTATHHALRRTQEVYYERYRFAEIFADLRRAPTGVVDDIRSLAGVAEVQAGVVADVPLSVPNLSDPATARLVGVEEDGGRLNRLHLRSGRMLEAGASDEVLASEGFVKANRLVPGDTVRAVINGRSQTLRIVGVALSPEYVFAIRPGDLMPDDRRYAILWMDRAALASAMDLTGAFNTVSLTLAPRASRQSVMQALDRTLAPYGGLQSYDREDHTSHRFVSDEIRQLKAMALVIPAIFLGVAAFLLGVVFSRLVATQRQQVGTLKALGYDNGSIALHYLQLAASITLAGTAIGAAGGFWMGAKWAALYAQFYRFPVLVYQAEWGITAQAALLALLATVIGAGTAALRVMRLPPAAAMLPEPPPTYGTTWLERLGLGRLLGGAGRMVLRNLGRRPLRAAMSALGIAAAVAILVVGFFFNDSLDYMLELAFDRAQHEDATVTFVTPLPASVLGGLEQRPGVISGELFRAVPVTLRNGHRTWRTAILGLSPDASLHRIVDADGRVHSAPASGLLLSTRLAKILNVRPGDRLLAEVHEGRRPAPLLRVESTVDDLMGVSAYMSLEALNELQAEGALASGAFLSIDSLHERQLFNDLRGMPKVAGVTLRSAALSSFRETSAQMMLFFAGVLILFAAGIAVGIVYNSGRITLAERERELATLRVLGFTRGETWRILAGEIAVHLILGIPAGFLGGFGLAVLSSVVFDSDLFRLPVVIASSTYAIGAWVVGVATLLVLLAVRNWLSRLDLVAVLKARE